MTWPWRPGVDPRVVGFFGSGGFFLVLGWPRNLAKYPALENPVRYVDMCDQLSYLDVPRS